jgi:serine/threonine protein kinase
MRGLNLKPNGRIESVPLVQTIGKVCDVSASAALVFVGPWQRKPEPSAFKIPSTSKPQNASNRVNKVVVKQTASKYSRAVEFLKQEGYFLKLLKGTGPKHLVKIYKDVVVESGGGTIDEYGVVGQDIARFFMEYCDGGDFRKFLRNMYKQLVE